MIRRLSVIVRFLDRVDALAAGEPNLYYDIILPKGPAFCTGHSRWATDHVYYVRDLVGGAVLCRFG